MEPEPPSTLQVQAWTKLWRIKAAATALIQHENDGVRSQAVKFVEALAVMCLDSSSVRPNHSLLSRSELTADAARQFTLLTQRVCDCRLRHAD